MTQFEHILDILQSRNGNDSRGAQAYKSLSRFIMRKENFGALLYDRHLSYTTALNDSEYNILLNKSNAMDIVIRENQNSLSFSAPLRVHLVLTQRCNLSCLHCLNESGIRRQEELEYFEIVQLFSELKQMGVFELVITGGEPLCHNDLVSIINLAKTLGFTILLNTNGICSQNKLEMLSRLGIAIFKISLDGLAQQNDNIRGKGTYQKIVQAIQYLKSKQQNVRINFTLMRSNQSNLEEIIRLANNLKCDLKINPLIPIGRGRNLIKQTFTQEEGQVIAKNISDYCYNNSVAIQVQIMSTLLSQSCRDTWEQFNYQYTDCGIMLTQITIDSDGLVYPMGRLTDLQKERSLGSIREESLDQLWEKAKIRSIDGLCHDCRSIDVNTYLFTSFNSIRPF